MEQTGTSSSSVGGSLRELRVESQVSTQSHGEQAWSVDSSRQLAVLSSTYDPLSVPVPIQSFPSGFPPPPHKKAPKYQKHSNIC